jgi:hypothetical protein
MGLDLAGLKTDLHAAFDATQVAAADAATAEQNFVDAIATAIDTYVRSAGINYESGLASPDGVVTGTFAGGLE